MDRARRPRTTSTPPELLPGRVRSGEIRLAKHAIYLFGLASDTVGDVTIDDTVALCQSHPDSEVYLCPIRPHPHPPYEECWFYADCLAYDHDTPAIVMPQTSELSRFRFQFVHSGPSKPREVTIEGGSGESAATATIPPAEPSDTVRTFYMQQLSVILEETRELRHGPLTYIIFRYPAWEKRVNLRFTDMYAPAEQQLHLYAMALRQADVLSEYLCYYRVIERTARSNGVHWIARNLSRVRTHDFGKVEIGHIRAFREPPRNLMAFYTRRARLRLTKLARTHRSDEKVAQYLYGVNRCGIAHGQAIVRSGLVKSYFDVWRDTFVLKLLARMAIDEAIR